MCQPNEAIRAARSAICAHLNRQAALVIGVEPHSANAGSVEGNELVIADVHRDRHHRPRPVRSLGIESRHAV